MKKCLSDTKFARLRFNTSLKRMIIFSRYPCCSLSSHLLLVVRNPRLLTKMITSTMLRKLPKKKAMKMNTSMTRMMMDVLESISISMILKLSRSNFLNYILQSFVVLKQKKIISSELTDGVPLNNLTVQHWRTTDCYLPCTLQQVSACTLRLDQTEWDTWSGRLSRKDSDLHTRQMVGSLIVWGSAILQYCRLGSCP